MTVDEIVWEDPPPRGSGPGRPNLWLIRIAPLRERPGQWANLGRHNTGVANKIRKFDGYEAVSRNSEQGQGDIYARYIGDKQ